MAFENILTAIGKSSVDIDKEIYNTIRLLYHGTVKLDMENGEATVLSSYAKEEEGYVYQWDEYLRHYVDHYILPSDRARALGNFSISNIKKSIAEGQRSFSCEFTSYVMDRNERHITMLAFMPLEEGKKQYAYVMVRNTGGDYLLNAIVNQYVYSTCDYFIYLDAKHNSYTMFSGQAGTPLPPEICTDYESAGRLCPDLCGERGSGDGDPGDASGAGSGAAE